jgi:hypothetical protein
VSFWCQEMCFAKGCRGDLQRAGQCQDRVGTAAGRSTALAPGIGQCRLIAGGRWIALGRGAMSVW